MADDVLEELKVKILGEVGVDKSSAKKSGEEAGEEFKKGMENVVRKSSLSVTELTKKLNDEIRKASNKVFLQDYKQRNEANWAEVQKANQAYKDMIGSLKYESVFGNKKLNDSASNAIAKQLEEIRLARENFIPQEADKSWNDYFGGLNEAVEKVDEFADAFKNSLGVSFIQTMFKGIANGFKSVGKAVKNTLKPLKNFFSAIKRIAIYRAIRAILKEIVQGFTEGRQNAYQWSVVTGNQFARSMDMMATSALYLKNSLGAMTMPLTNFLAPILDQLIDQFVNLINVVNQFIATITGASSWTKALKYPAQYMDSMAGSAKQLKNQLLSFDDLNVLNAPSGSGSASAMDYSNMFQQMELSGEQVNFTKSLMEAIKNSDWDALEELLDEQINGLIEKIDAKGIAKSLGEKLNKAIRFVHTLLKAIDFHQIGVKIGEFISNLRLDWNIIAQSWVRWATNIADVLMGVIQGINWANVGHSLGEFIKGLFNGISTWLQEVDWKQFGADVTQGFFDLIGSIDWNGILRSMFSGVWSILQGVWNGISGAWRTLIRLFTGEISLQDVINGVHHSGMSYYEGIHISIGGVEHSSGGGRGFAEGGFPEQGTYFYAGENGAEFVGQVGGRTAVYNADQMTGALATANEGVVNTLTAVGNAIVSAINHKDMSINTNDVRRAISGMNMRYGV